ncbi:hypothetical protein N9121_00705 [Pseudomonadales bacterium]|nr:hypothetical protein [Pseudomonadales bacterium]
MTINHDLTIEVLALVYRLAHQNYINNNTSTELKIAQDQALEAWANSVLENGGHKHWGGV